MSMYRELFGGAGKRSDRPERPHGWVSKFGIGKAKLSIEGKEGGRLSRQGFSLAEALMMVIIAGSCMIPILGTLHSGIDRTESLGHQARMRMIAESQFNECMANVYFNRLSIPVGTFTVPYPDGVPPAEQLATYVVNIAVTGRMQIATIPGGIPPSGLDLKIVGSQPRTISEFVVTVSLVNDDPTQATESVRVTSLVALPIFETMNRIFISDPVSRSILPVDPFARKAAPQSFYTGVVPGNLAVHPNGKWLFYTTKLAINAIDIDPFSPEFGAAYEVFSHPGTEFLLTEDVNGVRTNVGIAFRPDGRYCYVATVKDGDVSSSRPSLAVFEVPTALPGPLIKVVSLPSNGFLYGQSTDFKVGQDGYLYMCRNEPGRFYRLSMAIDPASYSNAHLQAYVPGFTNYTVPPIAVSTSRSGRHILSLWPDTSKSVAWSESANPAKGVCGPIGKIDGFQPSGSDFRGVEILHNNRYAILALNYNFGGFPAKYYQPIIKIPPIFNSLSDMAGNYVSPNAYIQNANADGPTPGEPGYFAFQTPNRDELAITQDQKGALIMANREAAFSGAYISNGVPDGQVVNLLGRKDAAIGVRPREEILVACSNGVTHQIERVDLYAQDSNGRPLRYQNEAISLSGRPVSFASAMSGFHLLVALQGNSGPIVIHNRNSPSPDPFSTPWEAGKCFFMIDEGLLIVNKAGTEYRVFPGPDTSTGANWDPSTTPSVVESLPSGYVVKDALPLNEGGALVLATNWTGGPVMATHSTILHWIGPDNQVWARWESRYDPFLPPVATKLAVTPDDRILALLIPDTEGGSEYYVDFFDFKVQDFATMTYPLGLIREIRTDNSKTFQLSAPSSNQTFLGSGIRLSQAFTRFGDYSSEIPYGLNFWASSGSKFSTRTTRTFGYIKIPSNNLRVALAWDEAYQWFIEGAGKGELLLGAGTPTTSGFQNSLTMANSGCYQFQVNMTDTTGSVGHGLFYNADPTKTLQNSDLVLLANTIGLSTTGVSNGWNIAASDSFRPMRFFPQFIHRWTSPDLASGDSILIKFGRDVNNPLLYIVNVDEGVMHTFEWGGDTATYDFSTGTTRLASESAVDMAVSPDNHRLLIAANSIPPALLFVDISIPPTASYGTIIASAPLPLPPVALGVRPFNRVYGNPLSTATSPYQLIATLPFSVAGHQAAAVAHGGIYTLGGANRPDPLGVPLEEAAVFNAARGTASGLGAKLRYAVRRQATVGYDGKLLAIGGLNEAATITAYVQQWDPRTNEIIPPREGEPERLIKTMTPKMTSNTAPAPHAITVDSFLTKNYHGYSVRYDGWKAMDRDTGTSWLTTTNAVHTFQFSFGTGKYLTGLKMDPYDYAFPDTFEFRASNVTPPDFTNPQNYDVLLQGIYTNFTRWWSKRDRRWYCTCYPQTFEFSTIKPYKHFQLYIPSVHKSDGTIISPGPVGITELSFLGYDPVEIQATDYMASITRDLPTTFLKRVGHAACLTPFGIMFAGGSLDGMNATNSVQVLWPHGHQDTRPQSSEVQAWWKFDDGEGLTAFDSAYNGNDGMLSAVSTPVWVQAGKNDGALDFIVASGGHEVQVPPGIMQSLGNFTIACWVKPTALSANARIFEFWSSPTKFIRMTVASAGTSMPLFEMCATSTVARLAGNFPLPLDTWSHLCVTGSGTTTLTFKFFVNGSQVATNSTVANLKPLHLGVTSYNKIGVGQNGVWLGATLDDLIIFNRALTDNEVKGLAGNLGLHVWYKLDDTINPTVKDSGGKNLNATTFGNPDRNVTGIFGKATNLNGSKYIQLPLGSYPGTPQFSISMWIKPASTMPAGARLIEVYQSSDYYWYLEARTSTSLSGKMKFCYCNGVIPTYDPITGEYLGHTPNTYSFSSVATYGALFPSTSDFYNVILTWQPGSQKIYVNGALAGSGNGTDAPSFLSVAHATIGWGQAPGAAYINGVVDDIMIFGSVLDPTEVSQIYGALLQERLSAKMTAWDKPSPNKVWDNGNAGPDYAGWKAFDDKNDKRWMLPKYKFNGKVTYDFGAGYEKCVNYILITNASDDNDRGVKTFDFFGSNDNSSWTLLCNGTVPLGSTDFRVDFSNNIAYRYYQFNPTSNWGDPEYLRVPELKLCGGPQPFVPTAIDPYEPKVKVRNTPWGITREVKSMNFNAAHCALVYHKGKVYRIGGSSSYTTNSLLGNCEVYDFFTNAWTTITGLTWANRVNFGACSFGDEIFIFGGGNTSNDPLKTAVAWNPETGTWRNLPDLPTPRYGCSAVPCGPHIYIIGGTTTYGGADGNTIYRYTP